MEKAYALYTDKDRKTLLSLASSKEELNEISLEFLSGVWFEYDLEIRGTTEVLLNERLYKGKPKFATEPIVVIVDNTKKEKFALHSGIGDLR